MAWQAIYTGGKFSEGIWYWTIVYVEDVKSLKIAKDYRDAVLTDAIIKQRAIAEVASLSASVAVDTSTFVTQPGQAIDLTPDAPVDPIDPDPARTQFATDVSRYLREQRAIELGFPVKTPMDFATVLAQWQDRFVDVMPRTK